MSDLPTYSSVTPGGVFDFTDEFSATTGTDTTGGGGTGTDGSSFDTVVLNTVAGVENTYTFTFSDSTNNLDPVTTNSFVVPTGGTTTLTARQILDLLNDNDGSTDIDDDLISSAIARVSALTAETNARIAADSALQTDIGTESTARQAADNSIRADLASDVTMLQSGIDTEVSDREDADTTLQDNIDAEETARESADTALQGNIDAEETARMAADTALDTSKQNVLPAYDTAPTSGSTNLVESGGVFTAINNAVTGSSATTAIIAANEAARDAVVTTGFSGGELLIQGDTHALYYWSGTSWIAEQDVSSDASAPTVAATRAALDALPTADNVHGQLFIQVDEALVYWWDDLNNTYRIASDVGVRRIEDFEDVDVTDSTLVNESVLTWDASENNWVNEPRDTWIDESQLRTDFAQEVIDRTAGDTALGIRIDTETQARLDGDTSIREDFVAIERLVEASDEDPATSTTTVYTRLAVDAITQGLQAQPLPSLSEDPDDFLEGFTYYNSTDDVIRYATVANDKSTFITVAGLNDNFISSIADPVLQSDGSLTYVATRAGGGEVSWTTQAGSTPTPGVATFSATVDPITITQASPGVAITPTVSLGVSGEGYTYTGFSDVAVTSTNGVTYGVTSPSGTTATFPINGVVSNQAVGNIIITGNIDYTNPSSVAMTHRFSVSLRIVSLTQHDHIFVGFENASPAFDSGDLTTYSDTSTPAANGVQFAFNASVNNDTQHTFIAVPTDVVGTQVVGSGTLDLGIAYFTNNNFPLFADDGDGWNRLNGTTLSTTDNTLPEGYQVFVVSGFDRSARLTLEVT